MWTEKAGFAGLFFVSIFKISQRLDRSMSDAQKLAGKVAIVIGNNVADGAMINF